MASTRTTPGSRLGDEHRDGFGMSALPALGVCFTVVYLHISGCRDPCSAYRPVVKDDSDEVVWRSASAVWQLVYLAWIG